MSKIICNVCGTSYPDSSTQCPICGCVRPADSVAVSENDQESGSYTYVKGGRFSKSNVRKRSHGKPDTEQGEKKPVNKKIVGLSVVLVCLAIIVALMVVFIVSYFNQNTNENGTPDVTGQEQPQDIPCTGLKLSQVEFTMTQINEVVILDAIPQPADTTDDVIFTSTDTNVVTVDEKTGKVLCVGPGKAEIRVSCGSFVTSCRVTCEVEAVPTDPSEPTVTVELMRKKIDDANYEGKFFYLYKGGDVSAEELTWISDDPKVAVVDQFGNVTAVGEGSTTIRAVYSGVTVASCEIICNFEVPDNGEDNPEGGDIGVSALVPYSHYGTALPLYGGANSQNIYDVTLDESKNEWLGLFLRDPNNPDNTVKVRWELDVTYGGTCEIDEDGYGVTATSSEACRIVAKYGNTYYYIIIR